MSEQKFAGRKWDARNWTREQKIQWQEKAFELGYRWFGVREFEYIDKDFFITPFTGTWMFFGESANHGFESSGELLTFEDMFPEEEEEKLDVIKEITELFYERLLEEDVSDEEERGFEGLVYVQPKVFGASVPLKNLTEPQIEFISEMFNIGLPPEGKTHFSCLSTGDRYYSRPKWYNDSCYNLSFNDLFKYEDELCSVQ